MLGSSLASPLLTFDCRTRFCFSSSSLDFGESAPNIVLSHVKLSDGVRPSGVRVTCSSTQTGSVVLSDEERKTWDTCRQALSVFKFSVEEEDKILGKAFGLAHSPYWGEERKKEVPQSDTVNGILNYLRSLRLSDDDLSKLLKKFPEVLGCSLEDELKNNVQVLEKQWGIKGKSLQNLLLRNPKVLGYNVDCKGDCMAQCTRCWVRF